MVQVTNPNGGTYGIDVHEVTRAEYQAWLDTNPNPASESGVCAFNAVALGFNPGSTCAALDTCNGTSCPRSCVDWCDARAYCLAVGKRLCGPIDPLAPSVFGDFDDVTKSQWFNACTNGNTTAYVTGANAGGCRVDDVGSAVPVETSSCTSVVAGYTGTHDLVGNVFEFLDFCNGTAGATDTCAAIGAAFTEEIPFDDCISGGHTYKRSDRFAAGGFRCCSP